MTRSSASGTREHRSAASTRPDDAACWLPRTDGEREVPGPGVLQSSGVSRHPLSPLTFAGDGLTCFLVPNAEASGHSLPRWDSFGRPRCLRTGSLLVSENRVLPAGMPMGAPKSVARCGAVRSVAQRFELHDAVGSLNAPNCRFGHAIKHRSVLRAARAGAAGERRAQSTSSNSTEWRISSPR